MPAAPPLRHRDHLRQHSAVPRGPNEVELPRSGLVGSWAAGQVPAVGVRGIEAQGRHAVERGGHEAPVFAEQGEPLEARGLAGGPQLLDRPGGGLGAAEILDEPVDLVDEEHGLPVDLQVARMLEVGLDPIGDEVVEEVALVSHASDAVGLVLPQQRELHLLRDG